MKRQMGTGEDNPLSPHRRPSMFSVGSQIERIQGTNPNLDDMERHVSALRFSSFFIFSGTFPPRVFVYTMVRHKIFETFVICVIVANCVTLAMDDPTTDKTTTGQDILEYTFTGLFSLELLLKVFAYGLILHQHAYLRSSWNVLDFLIVCLSYLSLLPGFGNYTAIRTLRVLRPLRSMNAVPGLRNIINGMFTSVRKLVHVVFLALLIFVIFGIVGVQLWNGLFAQRCFDVNDEILLSTFCKNGTTMDGFNGRNCQEGEVCVDWAPNPHYGFMNFDHMGWALLTIFQVITMEGWTEIMYITFAVWGAISAVYFVLLVVIGSYIVLNLALAVINDEFNQVSQQEQIKQRREAPTRRSFIRTIVKSLRRISTSAQIDVDRMDEANETIQEEGLDQSVIENPTAPPHLSLQRDDSEMSSAPGIGQSSRKISVKRKSLKTRARQSLHKFRKWLRVIIVGVANSDSDGEEKFTLFGKFILFCIVLNTAILAGQYHGQPDWLSNIYDMTNLVLTCIFAAEMAIKVFAFGPLAYALDRFNILDGTIVIVSIIELGISGNSTVSVFRALRLLRVFKLLKSFPALRAIVDVILSAVAETGYLNIIIILYLFIASLVGMSFFGGAIRKIENDDTGPIRSTFDSFYWSLLTVFQIMTRDDWTNVMWNAMKATSEWASLYFVGLVLIGDFLILNLFLAILIQAFDRHGTDGFEEDASSETDEKPRLLQDTQENSQVVAALASSSPAKLMTLNEASSLMLVRRISRNTPSTSRAGSPCYIQQAVAGDSTLQLQTATHLGASGGSGSDSNLHTPQHTELQNIMEVLSETLEMSSNRSSSLGMFDDEERCLECGGRLLNKFPPSPGVKVDAHMFHRLHCSHAQIRKHRQKVLSSLTHNMREISKKPFHAYHLYNVLGVAWEAGCLLNYSPEYFAQNEMPYTCLTQALQKDKERLKLKIGEECVGRGAVAAARGSAPKKYVTNGSFALYSFGPEHPFRIFCWALVHHPMFDGMILFFILISSAMLAFDDPRSTSGDDVYAIFSTVFTVIFLTEMILKIFARGLVMHHGAYLRDPWNVMDGTIVIISVVAELMPGGTSLSTLKVFRAFRTLRPLRVVNRNRGLKMVVITLLSSIKGISSVALICFFVFFTFGILGVQLMSGNMYYCNDTSIVKRTDCTGLFLQFGSEGSSRVLARQWVAQSSNFDNIFNGILTLFEVASLEMWNTIMYKAIDSSDYDNGPQRDNNPLMGLYFVVFVVIGAFFMLNLFVGVVIYNFNSVKSQMDGLYMLTQEQKLWVETQRFMLNFRPTVKLKPRNSRLEAWCFWLASSREFEIFIGCVILANVVLLTTDHHDPTAEYDYISGILNSLLSYVFVLEAILKLIAYNYKYFWDSWNRFDFLLVLLSVVGLFLDSFSDSGLPVSPGVLRVFRVFRVLRILRLVRQAKQVRILLETLWYSLPSLGNIGAFLFLLFFMYAILGMQLFGLISSTNAIYMNDYVNFHTFPQAFLLLVQVTTGDSWNGLMHDCMVQPPDCQPDYDPETDTTYDTCGNPIVAPIFFITFLIIGSFVLTNLFIAIILDNFDVTMKIEKSKLTTQDLQKFVDRWSEYDENATLLLPTHKFPDLLAHLPPPVGLSCAYTRMQIIQETRKFLIPEHGGVIHFVETLIPIARKVLKVELAEKEIREHEDMWRVAFPDIAKLPVLRYGQKRITVDQYYAATYIQAAYKRTAALRLAAKLREDRLDAINTYCYAQGLKSGNYTSHLRRRVLSGTMPKQLSFRDLRLREISGRNSFSSGASGGGLQLPHGPPRSPTMSSPSTGPVTPCFIPSDDPPALLVTPPQEGNPPNPRKTSNPVLRQTSAISETPSAGTPVGSQRIRRVSVEIVQPDESEGHDAIPPTTPNESEDKCDPTPSPVEEEI
eukprot:PhF_6_TR44136/c0_g1_i1/m.67462